MTAAERVPLRQLVDDRLLDALLERSRDQAGGLRLAGEAATRLIRRKDGQMTEIWTYATRAGNKFQASRAQAAEHGQEASISEVRRKPKT